MVMQLDAMRRDEFIKTIVNSGWKPVGTLITLGSSSDPYVAGTAIRMLGNMGDPKATDLLLRLLEQPENNDTRVIITALGETRDNRAIETLTRMAQDPAKRAGKEAELGEALANLGDQRAADVIVEMIKKTPSWPIRNRLARAYKKLTGIEYKL